MNKNASIQIPSDKTAQFEFETTEERDKFIKFFFPERALLDSPGWYKIANGNLGVVQNVVTIYRQ
jgi:hypothetical protein